MTIGSAFFKDASGNHYAGIANAATWKFKTAPIGTIPVVTHIISFEANGGTGSMADATVNDGDPYPIPANQFTRAGYTFSGWNTQANKGGTAYGNKATISSVTADITLYAQWTNNGGGSPNGGGSSSYVAPTPAYKLITEKDKAGKAIITFDTTNNSVKNGVMELKTTKESDSYIYSFNMERLKELVKDNASRMAKTSYFYPHGFLHARSGYGAVKEKTLSAGCGVFRG